MVARWMYLVVYYWKMFYEVKWDIPVLRVSISRLWLFFSVAWWVSWASVTQQYLLEKVFAFSFLFLILEFYRISNRCGIDPVHLFYLNVRFFQKYLLLALIEVFGPAFFVLMAFLVLHIELETQFLAFFVCLYLVFVFVKLAVGVLSSRYLHFTVVYLWILIVSGSISGGMSGLLHNETYEITKILDRFFSRNFDQIVNLLKLSCIVFLFFGFALARRSYKCHPFVDPHSFPKKLL
ncbi:hypothetical protein ADIS_0314 [Lunatimonas lonarensis]|uniref:Transmembrane protein n=1 Tax=Lunatimonas lonarensis TaxID=1232681 RepID=R7ZYP0_9BACT|nr:hypothetical protein ADIS_0314 [Lunatimonas lonarensis]